MNVRRLLLLLLFVAAFSYSHVWSAAEGRVFDCVRFAANGNDVVVDTDCLLRGLRDGADPNWVNLENKRHESTLSRFVQLVSISRDPKVISEGTEAVKTLIGSGAKLQRSDAAILFWPISQGNLSLVRTLLELGASATAWPNSEIGTALSPVERAAAVGYGAIVDLLVEHGAARPSAKEALQEGFVRSARFGSIEDLAALVSQGANVNGKSRDNEIALINAMPLSTGPSGCTGLNKIQWLLEKGADANLMGKGVLGIAPPLHEAVWINAILYKTKQERNCSDQILRELIKRGAFVSGVDSMGRTPLHIAAENNSVPAAQLLIQSGAKVMPRDEKGRTPLDMAQSTEMIRLLKRHGAVER